jgi:hypothetical protein
MYGSRRYGLCGICFQKFDGAPGYARQFLRRRTRQTMFRALDWNKLVRHAGFVLGGDREHWFRPYDEANAGRLSLE